MDKRGLPGVSQWTFLLFTAPNMPWLDGSLVGGHLDFVVRPRPSRLLLTDTMALSRRVVCCCWPTRQRRVTYNTGSSHVWFLAPS